MGRDTRAGTTGSPLGRVRPRLRAPQLRAPQLRALRLQALRLRALRSGLVYTRVFEDHEVDRHGLGIGPGDDVLVIASAGDKALNAIADGARTVDAVDSNPAQLHLLALELAAVRSLDHGQLVELFSDGRSATARATYEARLRPLLDEPARRYWDRWIGIFEVGLHRHNPPGLARAAIAAGLRFLGGPLLGRAILLVPDAAAQGRVYERVFRRRYFNPVTRWLLRRAVVLRSMAPAPGKRADPGVGDPAEWLEPGLSRVARTSLIRENPFWMPILTGRPVDPRFEVRWLRVDALPALAAGADRVRLVDGSVVEALTGAPGPAYTAVDLSNVPDRLDRAERGRLWDGLCHAVRPGGRVLLRSVFAVPPLPAGRAADGLVLDRTLSAVLADEDRTGLYRTFAVLRRADDGDDAADGGHAHGGGKAADGGGADDGRRDGGRRDGQP